MKALTLHQPWASLIAVGAKRIETRSWSTSYRGPLAIHAGLRPPKQGLRLAEWWVGSGPHRELLMDSGVRTVFMPLGAVVATCRLVDVVPTDQVDTRADDVEVTATQLVQDDHGNTVAVPQEFTVRFSDERLFGDFTPGRTPGRYAWLLADVEPMDPPVPAKGRQGLWEWGGPA